MQPATSTTTNPSCGGALQVRTAFLASLARFSDEHLSSAATVSPSEADSPATSPHRLDKPPEALPRMMAQCAPALTSPAWAMEECVRLCPAAELWCGSALPKEVWAPPGTPECPFHSEPVDFHAHH